jgi:hypothetical protein
MRLRRGQRLQARASVPPHEDYQEDDRHQLCDGSDAMHGALQESALS